MKNYAIVPFWAPLNPEKNATVFYHVENNSLYSLDKITVNGKVALIDRYLGNVYNIREMSKVCRADLLTQDRRYKSLLLKKFVCAVQDDRAEAYRQMRLWLDEHYGDTVNIEGSMPLSLV
jgi:hypothetical protein